MARPALLCQCTATGIPRNVIDFRWAIMAPGRAKMNGARLSTELDSIAIGVTTEKTDEFIQLFLHAIGNKDIAVKLRAAMGVSQQLSGLQQEVHALRSEPASKDARIETLQKKVYAIELQQDELEQYSRRNSVRLSGLTEEADEDVVKGLLVTLNHVMCITPPIDISEIVWASRRRTSPGRSLSSSPRIVARGGCWKEGVS